MLILQIDNLALIPNEREGNHQEGGELGISKFFSVHPHNREYQVKVEIEKKNLTQEIYTGSVQLLDLRPVPRHSGIFHYHSITITYFVLRMILSLGLTPPYKL